VPISRILARELQAQSATGTGDHDSEVRGFQLSPSCS
jgi:hypothetical protein